MTDSEVPQVYVNVSGGIAEVTVTRGEVEIIKVDWDDLEGAELDILLHARWEIEQVANEPYRATLLADINHLLDAFRRTGT